MTAALWLGLVLLAAGAVAILVPRLSRDQRFAGLLFAAAAVLAVLRLFALAVPLGLFAFGLWRKAAPIPADRASGQSEVASAGLRMTLDRASGEIDGTVLAGRFAGVRLSALSPADLRQLARGYEQDGDEESLALLLAYLERRGIPREDPDDGGGAASGGPMSQAEALEVLGLAPGASRAEVRDAYRRLIRRVHPDLGGSNPLASLLNRARAVLDPD